MTIANYGYKVPTYLTFYKCQFCTLVGDYKLYLKGKRCEKSELYE